jgi:hypothetical protein
VREARVLAQESAQAQVQARARVLAQGLVQA